MIEIVCPSCQARYQLPEGSIGPEGRKVSCSSCSHKWRAYPEGEASSEAPPIDVSVTDVPAAEHEEPVSDGPVVDERVVDEPVTDEPVAEYEEPVGGEPVARPEEFVAEIAAAAIESTPESADFGIDTTAPSTMPPPATGDRDEQMAAIRQMLSDLKEGADAAPEMVEEERPAPATSSAPARRRAGDEGEGRDQLKSRIDDLSKTAKAVKGQPEQSGYDAAKLRRMHEKRAKKLQRAKERRNKSGAFITGFTLVSVVTATMVGLYVLRPQIVEAMPKMAPALNEYVVTIDRYRVEMNEFTIEWRAWLTERIGKLTGKKEE